MGVVGIVCPCDRPIRVARERSRVAAPEIWIKPATLGVHDIVPPLARGRNAANIWWPDEHAWCVATEIDVARWSYRLRWHLVDWLDRTLLPIGNAHPR